MALFSYLLHYCFCSGAAPGGGEAAWGWGGRALNAPQPLPCGSTGSAQRGAAGEGPLLSASFTARPGQRWPTSRTLRCHSNAKKMYFYCPESCNTLVQHPEQSHCCFTFEHGQPAARCPGGNGPCCLGQLGAAPSRAPRPPQATKAVLCSSAVHILGLYKAWHGNSVKATVCESWVWASQSPRCRLGA